MVNYLGGLGLIGRGERGTVDSGTPGCLVLGLWGGGYKGSLELR